MVVEEKTAELSELPPLEEIRGPATRRAGFLGWLLYYSPGILFIAALIALWHALWHFQVFAEQYISNPVQVFWTFVELIRTDHPEVQLFGNVLASLKAQVTGFLLGGLVGIPLGILIGSAEFARRLLMPFIRFIYPIPGIAWVPFAIRLRRAEEPAGAADDDPQFDLAEELVRSARLVEDGLARTDQRVGRLEIEFAVGLQVHPGGGVQLGPGADDTLRLERGQETDVGEAAPDGAVSKPHNPLPLLPGNVFQPLPGGFHGPLASPEEGQEISGYSDARHVQRLGVTADFMKVQGVGPLQVRHAAAFHGPQLPFPVILECGDLHWVGP